MENSIKSIGFPLIGAGTGGGKKDEIQQMICDEIQSSNYDGRVLVVRYKSSKKE